MSLQNPPLHTDDRLDRLARLMVGVYIAPLQRLQRPSRVSGYSLGGAPVVPLSGLAPRSSNGSKQAWRYSGENHYIPMRATSLAGELRIV